MALDSPHLTEDALAEVLLDALDQIGVGVMVTSGAEGAMDLRFINDAALEMGAATLLTAPRALTTDRGSVTSHRVQLVNSNASAVHAELSTVSLVLDAEPSSVSLLVDVSDRLRAARELEQLQTQFQRVLELSPVAVGVRQDQRLVFANAALRSLLRLELKDTAPGEPQLEPSPAVAALAVLDEALDDAGLHERSVTLTLEGTRGLDVELTAIQSEWHQEPAVMFIARDPGQRQRLHARLAEAERLAAVSTLGAGVAHEVNNPLAYVLLNLQYLLRELPRFNGDPARLQTLRDRLSEARHGAERIRSIVRDLLDFSSVGRPQLSPVDLTEVVERALRLVEPQLKERAEVVTLLDEVPLILGNASQLEQVLTNLLVNAAQAISPETARGPTIEVRCHGGGFGRVLVEVSDTGTGISLEHASKVFDPFFTTKPVGVGTGLGLPICHSIVRAHGGDISVDSTPGVGTTFRLVLPALPSASSYPPPMPSSESSPPRSSGDDEPSR